MGLTILILAGGALVLSVARWLYLERRFARPEVPGRKAVRLVGSLSGEGIVERTDEGAPPFDLRLAGPVVVEIHGRPVRVLTGDAVLDMGWGPRRGADLPRGRLLTIDGGWTTIPRDGLYREAGRVHVLDAVRVVTGTRPGLLRAGLPVLLATAAVVLSLSQVETLPAPMRATADALRCPAGTRRVTMNYTGDRGWVHACTRPDQTLHGPWLSYHASGAPWRRATYRHGELHGTEMEWLSSGLPGRRTDYRSGQRHGVVQVWHPDGVLHISGRYHDGRRHGQWWRLAPDGSPVEKISYCWGWRLEKTLWGQQVAYRSPGTGPGYVEGWRCARP